MHFFGLFWAKMTKIYIENPKLIVTNDYQHYQLWHILSGFYHFFQISDVKHEASVSRSCKPVYKQILEYIRIFNHFPPDIDSWQF